LRGSVHKTMLRGDVVFEEGRFPTAASGRVIMNRRV
jgi:hypothetical protein